MKKVMISVALVAICSLAANAADHKQNGPGNGNGNINKNVVPTNFPSLKTSTNKTVSSTTTLKPQKLQNLTPKYTAKDYNLKFGKKYDFGWCYKGKYHDHWTCCCWLDECGCTCYWCPCTLVWYYYCVPDDCWYPVTYYPYGVYVW